MAQIGTVSVVATIDTSQYKRGAKEVETANSNIAGSADKSGSSLERLNTRLGRMARTGLKVAVGGFVGLATAIATMTIRGGISRALNIEDAQAKLKGLGHDAESVTTIMESALASVKGTAFGLDEAATSAATAVAAGVKPGKDLTRYLKTAADAATIAGVSIGEMGSIFGKVQTNQKAYTQELNQLADRGIPIYQWLQKELGVSAIALRKMVADGEIDSAIYFKVIQKNIGGAALESGKTTRGAWKNMLAAMSRVGERIVSGPIDKIRGGFGDMTKWIDNNSDAIVKAVEDTMDVMIGLAKVIGTTARVIWNLRTPIAAIVVAYGAYRATVIATNTVLGIQRLLFAATGTQVLFMNGTLVALRTTTVAATIAQKALNLAMKLNPIGLVIAALGGLVTILGLSKLATEKQDTATDRLNLALKAGKTATDNLRTAEDNLKNARLEVEGSALAVERAQRTYNETVEQYGPKSLEAREAAYALKTAEERLRDANKEVEEATDDKTEAEKNNAKAKKNIESAEADKRDAYRRTTSVIGDQKDELGRLGLAIDGINGKKATYQIMGFSSAFDMKKAATGKGTPYAMPRFNGGPVSAGRAYLVGENRDGSLNDTSELFIPNRSGRIVGSKDLQGAISSEKRGDNKANSVHVDTIIIEKDVDIDLVARKLGINQLQTRRGIA